MKALKTFYSCLFLCHLVSPPETFAVDISISKQTKLNVQAAQALSASTEWFAAAIYPCRDGGFLFANQNLMSDWILERRDASNEVVWSTFVPHSEFPSFYDGVEGSDGTFLFPANISQVMTVDKAGTKTYALVPATDRHQKIARTTAAGAEYLVGGVPAEASDRYYVFTGLHHDLHGLWRVRIEVPNSGLITALVSLGDGTFAYSENGICGMGVSKANTNGVILWSVRYRGENSCDPLAINGIIPVRDGGFILACSSSAARGYNKQVEVFGNGDIWLVKIDANGTERWQRSYGGVGYDTFAAMTELDDGGFLLCAKTQGSGVTGNKTADGNGIWLLKLDSRGLKETETVIDGQLGGLVQRPPELSLITTPGGLPWTNSLVPLTVSRRVNVSFSNPTEEPYSVETSSDLLSWETLVTGFRGDLTFSEPIFGESKFYRAR